MGKLTWIIVAVLLFLLFRDKIGAAADAVTGRSNLPIGYGTLPAPNYYSSPPTSRPSTVTDIVNNLITAGTQIWGNYNSPSDPGVDYSSSANYND
jgi:hypothetical protein